MTPPDMLTVWLSDCVCVFMCTLKKKTRENGGNLTSKGIECNHQVSSSYFMVLINTGILLHRKKLEMLENYGIRISFFRCIDRMSK